MRVFSISICVLAATLLQSGLAQAATTVPAAPANVPATAPAPLQVPSAETQMILIRAGLVALSQANVTNNYAVLNALGSAAFRQANPPQLLAQNFESFRTNKIDLSPVVLVNPQLTQPAAITNGKLRLVGIFPTQPMRVNFDLQFEPENGVWKMFGLGVNLQRVPATAPTTAPAAASPPARR